MAHDDSTLERGSDPQLTRRGLLVLGAATLTGLSAVPSQALALAAKPRSISLINLHTKEEFAGIFWSGGRLRANALERLNHVLRDHRTDEVYPIAPNLLDVLHDLHARLSTDEPFHVVSGYRSPKTNARLRKKSKGVARKSFHMRGMAIDIRVPGVDTASLTKAARAMRAGGVGYYRKSGFIHLDIGPVRNWNG